MKKKFNVGIVGARRGTGHIQTVQDDYGNGHGCPM